MGAFQSLDMPIGQIGILRKLFLSPFLFHAQLSKPFGELEAHVFFHDSSLERHDLHNHDLQGVKIWYAIEEMYKVGVVYKVKLTPDAWECN